MLVRKFNEEMNAHVQEQPFIMQLKWFDANFLSSRLLNVLCVSTGDVLVSY